MAKKGNVFTNLFKSALGLPTSDCCSVPVVTNIQEAEACCDCCAPEQSAKSEPEAAKG